MVSKVHFQTLLPLPPEAGIHHTIPFVLCVKSTYCPWHFPLPTLSHSFAQDPKVCCSGTLVLYLITILP